MSDQLKVRLISLGNAFATGFILAVAAYINTSGSIVWSDTFWVGVIVAGVNAGIVEVTKSFTPVRLGGRR